jgi:hypothetical protein
MLEFFKRSFFKSDTVIKWKNKIRFKRFALWAMICTGKENAIFHAKKAAFILKSKIKVQASLLPIWILRGFLLRPRKGIICQVQYKFLLKRD